MRYHLTSTWCPKSWDQDPVILRRSKSFASGFKRLFHYHRNKNNLLPIQRMHLKWLQNNRHRYIIVNCDKNLGPAVLETNVYISRAIHDHLRHGHIYRKLSHRDADTAKQQIIKFIRKWIRQNKDDLTSQQRTYLRYNLRNNISPWSYFYIMVKIHKNPWATRPVVSYSGSLLFPLAVVVERQLQIVAQLQPSYLKNSSHLKTMLLNSSFPPNSVLFTADASSMYTNIPTTAAIPIIQSYLESHQDQLTLPAESIISTLSFLMEYNIFKFGDMYFQQLEGAAMGAPPAPPYANLFFNKKETTLVPSYSELIFYKRYIDDVIGVWIPSDGKTWESFQQDMNDFHGLKWDISPLQNKVDFLDLTISINNGIINTTLFEKLQNLHLYITPQSAHPPGVLKGLVFGQIYRIYDLCTDHSDICKHIQDFFKHLRARGHTREALLLLFRTAILRYSKVSDIATPPIPNSISLTSSQRIFVIWNTILEIHLRINFKNFGTKKLLSHHLVRF